MATNKQENLSNESLKEYLNESLKEYLYKILPDFGVFDIVEQEYYSHPTDFNKNIFYYKEENQIDDILSYETDDNYENRWFFKIVNGKGIAIKEVDCTPEDTTNNSKALNDFVYSFDFGRDKYVILINKKNKLTNEFVNSITNNIVIGVRF